MTSRLLSRLESDIRGAPDALTADCLRCERAAYLARLGDGAAAAKELADVQRRHAARPDAAVSGWVHFAQALVDHFGSQAPQSQERMKRAHALGTAAGVRSLQAFSAAWLGQFDYRAMRPEPMARYAALALELAAPEHHAARSRASLVVAQAYHDGGLFERARPWYDAAHRHATKDGDDTTLSAIMSNKTSLHIVELQQLEGFGMPQGAPAIQARASVESHARFEAAFGISSLSERSPMLHAQAHTLLGDTDQALALFERHLDAALTQGMDCIEGNLRADRAWCRLRDRQLPAARADAELAEQALLRPCSLSDRAAAHDRLRQVFDEFGDEPRAQRHAALAHQAWGEYRALQVRMVDAMDRALDGRGPA